MHLGAGEIALLIVLALVLFGAKRLPQVGRAAGEAIREFKAAFNGVSKLKDDVVKEENPATDVGEHTDGEGNGNKTG
jgi:sec-independent protein translocase protein TatA